MAAKLLTFQLLLKLELMHNKTRRTSRLEIAAKFFDDSCHDPLPVGISLAVEEYRNSREEKDTAELHNIK